MRTVLFALLTLLAAAPARSTPTMAIWGDDGSGLSPDLTIQGDKPFDVVVTLDSDGNDAKAAEWVMTDLRLVFPGVFAIATQKISGTVLDLGENDLGEYLLYFGCEPSGDRIELVRITYADLGGVVGVRSALLTLRGFEPGDTLPSSFGGQPGFIDCSDPPEKYSASMGGHENEGALCVNCYSPPEIESSVAELKSKF